MPEAPIALIPRPRSVKRRAGRVGLRVEPRWLRPLRDLDATAAGLVQSAANRGGAGRADGRVGELAGPPLRVALRPLPFSESDDAYRVCIAPEAVTMEAASLRALYYAAQTLASLLEQYGSALPRILVEDYPVFAVRGFLHDVSRGKVPKRSALFALVERLAALKYNQLQLYVEHTFAFEKHPLPGRGHSPLKPADIRALGRHCRRHHIDLVPCLQSFGHASHFLRHERYAHLAESDFRGGWTLSPAERGTYRLLHELYAEFLPCFPPGKRFNACCDETWDLGRGKTRNRVVVGGLGEVYVSHLLKVRKLARRHGREPLFWADILEKHPHHVVLLPADVGLLYWNYDAAPTTADARRRLERLVSPTGKERPLADRREFWVCPGTSAWNSLFFRSANAAANIFQTARAGADVKANGFLLTDWGDNGHYNFLSASLWPMAWAAECAWNAPKRMPDERAFDRTFGRAVLGSADAAWTRAARLLGGLDETFGVSVPNHSPERWLLTGAPPAAEDMLGVRKVTEPYRAIRSSNLRRALTRADRAAALLTELKPEEPEIRTVRDEWLMSARLASFACRRTLLERGEAEAGDTAATLREEIRVLARRFEQLWLARNRPSDLRRIRRDFRRIEAVL